MRNVFFKIIWKTKIPLEIKKIMHLLKQGMKCPVGRLPLAVRRQHMEGSTWLFYVLSQKIVNHSLLGTFLLLLLLHRKVIFPLFDPVPYDYVNIWDSFLNILETIFFYILEWNKFKFNAIFHWLSIRVCLLVHLRYNLRWK